MASYKSFKAAFLKFRSTLKKNPKISGKDALKAYGTFAKEASEADIRWATVPSLIAPMPKSAVDKLA